jgi:hypothetical protein
MNHQLVWILFLIILFIVLQKNYNSTTATTTNNHIENYSNELYNNIKLSNENNAWDQLQEGPISPNCYNLSYKKCLDCSNCGICLINGQPPQCVPGDEQGPFFKSNCDKWLYSNFYDRRIFNEKITSITDPWNKFYPDYEAWYPMHLGRAQLIY